ncbi:MAG: WD40 repeat domain-containing protein [Acidobacteria bacterium]|nr:WD40 repeat domain-containing protein [Acidobacteriota bacterium]
MSFKRLVLLTGAVFLLVTLCGCDFTQYIAHYAKMAGWSTTVSIQNPHREDVSVTVVAYGDNGVQAASKGITIPARGYYSNTVQNIFAPTNIPDTGSLKITASEPSNVPKVNSLALFDYGAGPALGGLQSFANPNRVVHFPWYDNVSPNQTGIAILNTCNWPIQVHLKASKDDGTTYYSSDYYRLAPHQKILGYASDFFGSGVTGAKTTVNAWASGPIAGFMILHNNTLQKVEAINGIPDVIVEPYFMLPVSTGPNVGSTPRRMEFTRDGNYLVIRTADGYRVYNRYDNTIVASSTSYNLGDLCLDPTGTFMYISDRTDGKIWSSGVPTGSGMWVRTERASLADVYRICVSPDGRYLAASADTEYRIWDIDDGYSLVTSGTITGGDLYECKFTNDSRYLLITNQANDTLIRYDTVGHTQNTTALSQTPRNFVQSTIDGTIYIATDTASILKVNGSTFATSGTISLSGDTYFLALSPDSKLLYATDYTAGTLFVYDLYQGGWRIEGTINASYPYCFTIPPEGDAFFYITHSGDFPIKWQY